MNFVNLGTNKPFSEKKAKTHNRRYKQARIIEKGTNLFAKTGNKLYRITLESFSPRGGILMYSLPSNIYMECYSPVICRITNSIIATRYSRVKPDMIVKGYLVDDEFHIIEYNILPKTEDDVTE